MPPAHDGDDEPHERSLERMNRFQEPEARALIADLRLPAGSRGLDVGCGVGLFAQWLAEAIAPGGTVVGVDRSADRVAWARRLVGEAAGPGRLELRPGDATRLDLPDASVDWVWCGDTLHHVVDTGAALREMLRVLRPGGLLAVKESQVLPALFLPGHPELERRIQLAEMEHTRVEGEGHSFAERRGRTAASLREAGGRDVAIRTYLIQRQAPLPEAVRAYVQRTVFERNWGPRLRERLAPEDWAQRSALCEAGSPAAILDRPDYYCLYPITVFTARRR